MLQFDFMHFLTGEELSQTELMQLINLAENFRQRRSHWSRGPLNGKSIALVFEKPSLRTRVSFTVGVQELGGQVLVLDSAQKKYEDPEDTVRVMQSMVHGMMLRTFDHSIFERMSSVAKMPLINGLSDQHHPCQALADLQTLQQHFGRLKGLKIAYVGDGNNVLHSLLLLAPFVGVDVHYACPEAFQPDADILARAHARAQKGSAQIRSFQTASQAVAEVDAIYTDVWISMGFEAEAQKREDAFAGYQLNLELLNKAKPHAIAMHCLPMVKGKEITREVVEHPRSALFAQAENRLHAQKALLFGIYSGLNARAARNAQTKAKAEVNVAAYEIG